jgi:hypothetical protein
LTNAILGKNQICGPFNEQWTSPITMNFDLHNTTLWCPPSYATGCYQFPTPSFLYIYPSTNSVTIQLPFAAIPCDILLFQSALCKFNVSNALYYSALGYNSQTKNIDCYKNFFPNSNRKYLSLFWSSSKPFDFSNQIQIVQLYQVVLSQSSNQASFSNIGKLFSFNISNPIDPDFWPFIFCNSDLGQNFATSTSDGINFSSFITLPKFSYISLVFINNSRFENISTNSIAISFFSTQAFINSPYSALTTSLTTFSSIATKPIPIFFLNIIYLVDGTVYTPNSASISNFNIILGATQNKNVNISLYWRNPQDNGLISISNTSYIFSFIKPINIIKVDPIANYIGNRLVSLHTDYSPYDFQNNIYFQCRYSLLGFAYSVNATVVGNIFSCYIDINIEIPIYITIYSVSKSEELLVSTTSIQYWILKNINILTWYPFVGSYSSPISRFIVKADRLLTKYDNILCFLKLNDGRSFYYQSTHSISVFDGKSILNCSFIYSNISIDNIETVTISLIYNATVINSNLISLSNFFNISMFRSIFFF